MKVVDDTLSEIGAGAARRVVVFNKIDAVADRLLAQSLVARAPGSVGVSARTGAGIAELEARVASVVQTEQTELELRVPAGEGRLLAFIEAHGEIVERAYDDDVVVLRVRVSPRDAARIRDDLERAQRLL